MSAQLQLLSGNLSICRIWRWPRSPAYLGHRDHCHQGPPTLLQPRQTQGNWENQKYLQFISLTVSKISRVFRGYNSFSILSLLKVFSVLLLKYFCAAITP